MQTLRFRDSRLGKRDEREKTFKRLPGITPSLTATIQPFETHVHDFIVKFPQRPGVSSHTIVVVMPKKLDIQGFEKPLFLLVSIVTYPDLYPFQGRLQFLAGCAPHDSWRAFPVIEPEKLKP